MRYINAEGIQIIIYEQSLGDRIDFFRFEMINDIHRFKSKDVILANRFDSDILGDVVDIVYMGFVLKRLIIRSL